MALYPTLLSFLTDLMIDIGALIQGQTPNASESSFLLNQTNNLFDEFSGERLMLFTQEEAVLGLSAKQTYQIGPGASDFPALPRPVKIDEAAMVVPGTTIHIPVRVMNYAEWSKVAERGQSGALVTGMYCDYNYPYATFSVTPIPTGNPLLSLFFRSVLAQFATLQDSWNLPPVYTQMIMKNLGVRIRSSFRSPLVDEAYIALALETKQKVKEMNAATFMNSEMTDLTAPAPIPGTSTPSVNPQPPQQTQQQG